MEVMRETALVKKTQLGRHPTDLRILMLQSLAARLDSQLHDESLRAAPKRLHKLSVQLPRA